MNLGMLPLACGCAMLLTLSGPLQAAPPTAPASAAPAGKIDGAAEIARLQESYKASTEAIAAERTKWVTALDTWYVGGLDKIQADRSTAGDLDGVLAVKAERARHAAQGAPSADELNAMPASLRALREAYNASQKKTADELARRAGVATAKLSADFEALQKHITISGDIEQALKVRSAKESVLSPAPAAPLASAPQPAPPAGSTPPPGASTESKDYLSDVSPAHDEHPLVLKRGARITTKSSFQPPVEITVVAKTEDTNLRIGYAADQIIFNWERGRTEFRIDGGPANKKHKPGAGAIPKDTFVTVRWRVTPEKQSVYVDDELRFEHEGDYSMIDKPVTIFSATSTITVQSLKVQALPAGTK